VTQVKRFYQTFYIKGKYEVDVAYIHNQRFWPVEVKWTNQIHTQDLKGIRKYKNGVVLSKNKEGSLDDIKILPLQRWLYEFSRAAGSHHS
jgi:predicted AAA+ superfamily ATPase